MSRHRIPLPPVAREVLSLHRRSRLLWGHCVACGQSWKCRPRVWAEDVRRAVRAGRRPAVTSLPIGHGTDTGTDGVSNDMADFRRWGRHAAAQGEATDASQALSGMREYGGLQPFGATPETRPVHVFGGRHEGDKGPTAEAHRAT